MVTSNMMSLIDSMFNKTFPKFERSVFFTPKVDVLEKENSFELHMALPGMKKEEINIEVNGEQISITGERKMRETKEGEKMHMVENYYGKFSRTFTLPENVNKQAIEAAFADGVLTLQLPKVEVKETKNTITVK
ncbi:MAG: Hsp20/alpha crystallin family protein [Bacteroidia bacterium]|nr:Hsp20/alpha crystallin family protein [Bacteroidia bacterium]